MASATELPQPVTQTEDAFSGGKNTEVEDVPALPSELPPLPSGPQRGYDVTSMSMLAGMFLTFCVFMVFGLYCEKRRRKRYNLYEWNNNSTPFTVPWYLYQMKPYGDSPGEKESLLSNNKHTTINMYTSKNKADSKYPKIKRKFPYFVTIPEEEEDEQDMHRFPSKIFPKSFPHF